MFDTAVLEMLVWTSPEKSDPSEDERTTRARIRDAAMGQFAELGFKGATVRGIAQSAGVSPGLVQHHFPTKNDLRAACDAKVMAFMEDVKDRGLRGGAESAAVLAGAFDNGPMVVRYLASALASSSEVAQLWFEELTEVLRGAIVRGDVGPRADQGDDVEAIAAVQAAMLLGLVLGYGQLVRALGGSGGEPEAVARIARARLALAPRGFREETLAAMRAGVEAYEARRPADDKQTSRRRRAR